MPTKRRVLIFLIVLSFMLLAKYVWGQEPGQEQVQWDPVTARGTFDAAYDAMFVAIFGPAFGVVAGLKMAWDRHALAKSGDFYRSRLVVLGL